MHPSEMCRAVPLVRIGRVLAGTLDGDNTTHTDTDTTNEQREPHS